MITDDAQSSYDNVQQQQNTGSFTHELVGGAAAFGAMKCFEDHQRREGKIPFRQSRIISNVYPPRRKASLPRLRQGTHCRLRRCRGRQVG